MNFSNLKYFMDIANARSITRGTEQNRISQSAGSQHIKELERVLEMKLFDRSTRPLKLTKAGQLYYELCRDVLHRKEVFETALDYLRNRLESTVRVISIYSVGLSEMSLLEKNFLSRYPEAELIVGYRRPERIYDEIVADRADIGLISYPEASKEINVIPWRNEEMVVAMALNHPLAKQQVIRFDDLNGLDYVGFDEDLPISHRLARFFQQYNITVNLTMHFDNIQIIKEAVALNSGVSILPKSNLRDDIVQGRLAGIPLEAPSIYRSLGIIHRRRKKFNRAIRAFLELLVEQPEEYDGLLATTGVELVNPGR